MRNQRPPLPRVPRDDGLETDTGEEIRLEVGSPVEITITSEAGSTTIQSNPPEPTTNRPEVPRLTKNFHRPTGLDSNPAEFSNAAHFSWSCPSTVERRNFTHLPGNQNRFPFAHLCNRLVSTVRARLTGSRSDPAGKIAHGFFFFLQSVAQADAFGPGAGFWK